MTTTKKCWSCDNITEYDVGWCDDCLKEIPSDVYISVFSVYTEPFAGLIRMAVADGIRMVRSKKNRYVPPGKFNLDDLEI